MRTGISGFQAQRLVEARKSLGITRVALASLAGVSPATVTNWERGTQLPTEERLRAIADTFKIEPQWFLTPSPNHGGKPYFYRSQASSTQIAREMARVRLDWVAEISEVLGQWVEWPMVNVPITEESQFLLLTDPEIESIALDCRRKWGLGLGPIGDILLALENAGIIVSRDAIGYVKMDGVSHWSQLNERPYVFITSDKANGIRNRFDAAHELGHLILHQNVDEDSFKKYHKEIERQADLFASSFLLPAESFSDEVKWPTLENLLALKKRWKVSVAAMVMRCRELGIIDDAQKTRLFKGRSSRGWTKSEPYDDQVRLENPRLLNRAIKMLVDQNVISKKELANKLGLPQKLLESLCGLNEGYFSDTLKVDNLVELKPSARVPSSKKDARGSCTVTRFPGNSRV